MLRRGETGDWVGRFSGHKGAIWRCDIDPTATRLITSSADYTARVWDCVNGQEVRKLDHGQVVRCSLLVPESTQLVTLAYKTIRLWDMRDKDCVSAVNTDRDYKQLVMCQEDAQLVYTRDDTSCISLMEVSTGKILHSRVLTSQLNQLSISHDGMLLLANHNTGITVLCEYSLDVLKEFKISGISYSAIHPSKEIIATSHNDNSICLTEFDTNTLIRTYAGLEASCQIEYSPDGEVIAVGTGNEVYLWPNTPGKKYGLWSGIES
ncbi:Serine-threonine kinase receptor-associated protein [Oopsacas minuta]|uniref:Serine-threonine kinase receptor-associated protein n=1 Tax=Oopsacas minuta TaxID=111878 RepID=A0AAV7KBP5_9METZ|nr:Serine-threonine kinase receptor-associated protein [Oopsacas minuta]